MFDFSKLSRLTPDLFQTLQNQIKAGVINAENIAPFLGLLNAEQLNLLKDQFPAQVNAHLELLNILHKATVTYVNGAKFNGHVSSESVLDIRERDAKLLEANEKAIYQFNNKEENYTQINTTLQRLVELSKDQSQATLQDYNYLLSRLAVLHIVKHRTFYGFLSNKSYGSAKLLATGSNELRKMLKHFEDAVQFDQKNALNILFKRSDLTKIVFNTEPNLFNQMQHDSEGTLTRLGNAPERIASGKLWHTIGKEDQSSATTNRDLASLLTPTNTSTTTATTTTAVSTTTAATTSVSTSETIPANNSSNTVEDNSDDEDEFFECDDNVEKFTAAAENPAAPVQNTASSSSATSTTQEPPPKPKMMFFARADVSKEPTYNSLSYITKFSEEFEKVKLSLAGKELSAEATHVMKTLEENIRLLKESTKLDLDSWTQHLPKLLKLKAAGEVIDNNFKNDLHIPDVTTLDTAALAQVYADHLYRNNNLVYSDAEVKVLKKHQNTTPDAKKQENANRARALQEKIDAVVNAENASTPSNP